MPEHDLVARGGEIAEDELLPGEFRLHQRLEMAVVLHPVGQRVADQGDVVAGSEVKFRGRCGVGHERRESGDEPEDLWDGTHVVEGDYGAGPRSGSVECPALR